MRISPRTYRVPTDRRSSQRSKARLCQVTGSCKPNRHTHCRMHGLTGTEAHTNASSYRCVLQDDREDLQITWGRSLRTLHVDIRSTCELARRIWARYELFHCCLEARESSAAGPSRSSATRSQNVNWANKFLAYTVTTIYYGCSFGMRTTVRVVFLLRALCNL